jgi:hypothetical protein
MNHLPLIKGRLGGVWLVAFKKQTGIKKHILQDLSTFLHKFYLFHSAAAVIFIIKQINEKLARETMHGVVLRKRF